MAKAINSPKKLLAIINAEKHKTKLKIKKIKCKCNHQGKSNYWIHPVKGSEYLCKCTECRRKIDLEPIDKETAEIKADIKKVFKKAINYCDIGKLQLNPKTDEKELKYLGEVQYGMERVAAILKAALGDEFKATRKKKKGKKKKGKKVNFTVGGRSMNFK